MKQNTAERQVIELNIPGYMRPEVGKNEDGGTRIFLTVETAAALEIPKEWVPVLDDLGLRERDVMTEFEEFTRSLTLRSVFNRITR